MKYFRFILALTIGALLNLLFENYAGGPIGFILIYAPKFISTWLALGITFLLSILGLIVNLATFPILLLLGVFEYLEHKQTKPETNYEMPNFKKVSGL